MVNQMNVSEPHTRSITGVIAFSKSDYPQNTSGGPDILKKEFTDSKGPLIVQHTLTVVAYYTIQAIIHEYTPVPC